MEKIEHINYIKAPVEKVYQALVTQDGLAAVWTTELIVSPEVGFINQFGFGDDYGTKMEIIELSENKRIEWKCLGTDPEWTGTGIAFELREKNGATEIELRHFDWRELTEFYRWCNYNWAMFLLSLKNYCEDGKGTPYQERKF